MLYIGIVLVVVCRSFDITFYILSLLGYSAVFLTASFGIAMSPELYGPDDILPQMGAHRLGQDANDG